MRRVVRDHVLAALRRQQRKLEEFISQRLVVSDAFPLDITERMAEIGKVGRLKIAPRGDSDFPAVDVVIWLSVIDTGS